MLVKFKYKIVDEDGKVVADNFRSPQTAQSHIPRLRLNRYDKLKVVPEVIKD